MPRRGAVDDVAVAKVAELLVRLVADIGLRHAAVLLLRQVVQIDLDPLGIAVAERGDLHPGDLRNAVHRRSAASADANEANLDLPAHQLAVGEILHQSAGTEAESVHLTSGGQCGGAHPGGPPEEFTTIHGHGHLPFVVKSQRTINACSSLRQPSRWPRSRSHGGRGNAGLRWR